MEQNSPPSARSPGESTVREAFSVRRTGGHKSQAIEMTVVKHLHVGGVIAMGFAPSGEYVLVISHSGRGVFSTKTWKRVARDAELAYPEDGLGVGIGPIDGMPIEITEKNYDTKELVVHTPDGSLRLDYDSGTITVSTTQD